MLRSTLAVGLVLMSIAGSPAQEIERTPAPPASQPFEQMIYKGVAGNFLDTVPIDPEARVNLQRANAVISSPLSWRSVGILLGVANPAFLVGGLVWGIWSAANIKAPVPDTSWLGSPRHERIGFCSRRVHDACRLHLGQEPEPAEATAAAEHTVMLTAR
jgi:hypothetical protein